jgi:hypothetical protein
LPIVSFLVGALLPCRVGDGLGSMGEALAAR